MPVLGHCLGLQLISRAFGAQVFAAPAREAGWQTLAVEAGPQAIEWTGRPAGTRVDLFAWHDEMASLPDGAVRLLNGHWCENQGFVLHGRHLALQSHLDARTRDAHALADRLYDRWACGLAQR